MVPQTLPPQAFSILSPRRQPRGWVELARRLVAFQSGLQLLDGVKALHCGVHVARVPKVGKPARRMEGLGTTLGVSAGDKRGKKVRTTHKHRGRERERACVVPVGWGWFGMVRRLTFPLASPSVPSFSASAMTVSADPPLGSETALGKGPALPIIISFWFAFTPTCNNSVHTEGNKEVFGRASEREFKKKWSSLESIPRHSSVECRVFAYLGPVRIVL